MPVTSGDPRAVVTGIGVVCPIGTGLAEFEQSLVEHRCGIQPVQAFDTSPFRSHLAGEVQGFDAWQVLPPGLAEAWQDRYLLLALAAARQALHHAGLPPDLSAFRAAISVGTCNGGLRTVEKRWQDRLADPEAPLEEADAIRMRYAALGQALSGTFGVRGPLAVVTTACSSSTNALGLALDLVQSGQADVVLAGGSDSLCLTTFAGFSSVKAMAEPGPCRPFSGGPAEAGMNLGEGSGFWVVESRDHALRRGARCLGEVLSYGLSADAHHLTAPEPQGEGAFRALRRAMERAGLSPDDLDHVHAHGTGTEANDRSEARALLRLMEGRVLPVTSLKSFLGHTLGAAGVLEATASLVGLRRGFIPPTLHYDGPRTGIRLDVVGPDSRPSRKSVFLKLNLAFSGNNAALAIEAPPRPDRAPPPRPRYRAVVTGLGAVSPFGIGTAAIRDGLRAGRTAVREVDRFDVSRCRCRRAAVVPEVDWRAADRRIDLRAMNPISRMAALAVKEALEGAGLALRPRTLEPYGLVMGVHVGPSEEPLLRRVWSTPNRLADPTGFAESVANSVGGYVSQALYLRGHSTTLATGPQSGVAALAHAAQAILLGHGSGIVAAAADEIFEARYRDEDAAGWLPPDPDSEGGRGWRGRLPGEGSAALLLEEAGTARARGARPLAEVLGLAGATDPGSVRGPAEDAGGRIEVLRRSLEGTGLGPGDIRAVAWAPAGGTPGRKDREAIEAVFGAAPPRCLDTVDLAGYADATSALLALVALLAEAPGEALPGPVMVFGSSPLGAHWAVLLGPPEPERAG